MNLAEKMGYSNLECFTEAQTEETKRACAVFHHMTRRIEGWSIISPDSLQVPLWYYDIMPDILSSEESSSRKTPQVYHPRIFSLIEGQDLAEMICYS
jgi:hypothetical protein